MLKSAVGRLGTLLFVSGIGALFAGPVLAEDAAVGKEEFVARCSACHGMMGLGDGPVGQLLKTPAPNLALLAEKSGGVFPFSHVYNIVDGRKDIAAHGTRDMPIWGDYYRGEALPTMLAPEPAVEKIVQGQILAIVYYVGTLQTKK